MQGRHVSATSTDTKKDRNAPVALYEVIPAAREKGMKEFQHGFEIAAALLSSYAL